MLNLPDFDNKNMLPDAGRSGSPALSHAGRSLDYQSPRTAVLRLAVLVDKSRLIHELRSAGFELFACLPVWYSHHDGHFDCVFTTRNLFHEEPATCGLGEVVVKFRERLSS